MVNRRKSLQLALIDGSAAKNPQNYRDRFDAPKPETGVGDPPKHLTKRQKAIWSELVDQCAPGVLSQQDRIAFEVLVTGVYRMRFGRIVQNGKKRTKYSMSDQEMHRLFQKLAGFGMTPASRESVTVDKPKADDDAFGAL